MVFYTQRMMGYVISSTHWYPTDLTRMKNGTTMMILKVRTMARESLIICRVSNQRHQMSKAHLQLGSTMAMEVVEVMMPKKTTRIFVKTPWPRSIW